MGSSGALAVGPAAVTSLMTAASVGAIATQGSMALMSLEVDALSFLGIESSK
jgi:hypothetical protein